MNANKEELNKGIDERINNFNDFISEIEKSVNEEIEKSKSSDSDLNQKAKMRNGIMNRIWFTLTKVILGGFKVKITLYYKEKVIFEYEIPKD